MTSDEWIKHHDRLRELAGDRYLRSYLLGRLCARLTAAELQALVEAALVYRERFIAGSNDRPEETVASVSWPQRIASMHRGDCPCDACAWARSSGLK